MERGALIGQGRTAEIYAWGEGQVIKLYRTEMAQEWAEREARVGRIAAAAGLQVPSIGDTIVVDGRPGILYERVDGLSMLEQLVRRPWQYAALARQFAGLHAAMHRCSSPELLPLRLWSPLPAPLPPPLLLLPPPQATASVAARCCHRC